MGTKQHIIKNFDSLASSPLRRQALTIAEAGFFAIDTKMAVKQQFIFDKKKQQLEVCGQKFNLQDYKKIICVGFGKAALNAVSQVQEILQQLITCGFVIDLQDGNLANIACRVGTHPYPTMVNVQATEELVGMLSSNADQTTLVICAVSGGGSALLCSPKDMSCETEVSIISALTVAGANIHELNTVRKHISHVKGGQLAKLLYPSTCISLIFSDVPGNDISEVASGPTVLDFTTTMQAAQILKKYNVLDICQLPACQLSETPKEKKYFERVHNFLLVSGETAIAAMKETAEDLGFDVKIFSKSFSGEAKDLAGQIIIANNQKNQCLLGSGESTVKIIGSGHGGRNQEMALAALSVIDDNQVLVCLASDGHDNTEAAGAIADSLTKMRAEKLALEQKAFLNNNDSFNFFEQVGDQVLTGLTGENVSDFFVCLKK